MIVEHGLKTAFPVSYFTSSFFKELILLYYSTAFIQSILNLNEGASNRNTIEIISVSNFLFDDLLTFITKFTRPKEKIYFGHLVGNISCLYSEKHTKNGSKLVSRNFKTKIV